MLNDLRRRWPQAILREDSETTGPILAHIFPPSGSQPPELDILVGGSRFQIRVWRTLLQIPPGRRVSYRHIAQAIGNAGAARAVGAAVGANPVAWLIPCHRVIRGDGQLGGYHWGLSRKQACLLWEMGKFLARESSC